jgi:acyl-CoA synthetase (AMP-forming)/AMP-acid ligase II
VPDSVRDEAIKALVIPAQQDEFVDIADLERFCADRLAAYKVPETFVVVGELPRTDVGKVDKRRCRELFGSGVAQ